VRRRWIAVIVVVAGAAIALGVVLVVNATSHAHRQVADLKAILDKVPLPAGTVLVHEQSYAAHGDVAGYDGRDLTLPTSVSSDELVKMLRDAGYQPFNLQTGQIDDSRWTSAVSDHGGDLRLVPPGQHGGGFQFTWSGTRLQMSIEPGDVT